MIPLAPALVVAAANAFVGIGEEGGNNRGQMVEVFLAGVGLGEGEPWCAAFVHHVGSSALYDRAAEKSSWPLPATASCWVLGDDAKRRGVCREVPAFGDVFLVYRPDLGRFAHTGFIIEVIGSAQGSAGTEWTCATIEGNTNSDGSREGDRVLRTVRTFTPRKGDRFIHWVDLEQRDRQAA